MKNRTVMDMVRSMLKDKGLPKKFWAEVYIALSPKLAIYESC